MGPGIFIKALLNYGITKEQIYSYDINSMFKEEIEKFGVNFKVIDTLLSISDDDHNRFDYIIGNPPYLNKASEYVRRHKKDLRKIYRKVNAHETYSMFIVNSIWRLKEGGNLGFITSDSFLSLNTHTKLRKFILDNCLIKEILLAPKNLFSNQKVSTSPAIIILEKCSNEQRRNRNNMLIIPRVTNEEEYKNPKKVLIFQQKKYQSLPFNIFFIDVEEEVINLFEQAPKLKEFLVGYIGMHTHDNKKYIAAIKGTKLAGIFQKRNERLESDQKYQIIESNRLNSSEWKPYLKRGGLEQYYRPISEALDWRENSIIVYDIPRNVPFEKEGIVISGVSSRLAARYMPEGCYWDSNKAMGFILRNESISIKFMLGLLNSSLYNYFAKGIINNTNSIQLTGIHALPFIEPNSNIISKIEIQVQTIMEKKQNNPEYDCIKEQKIIDNLIFNFIVEKYDIPLELKTKLDKLYSIYAN